MFFIGLAGKLDQYEVMKFASVVAAIADILRRKNSKNVTKFINFNFLFLDRADSVLSFLFWKGIKGKILQRTFCAFRETKYCFVNKRAMTLVHFLLLFVDRPQEM